MYNATLGVKPKLSKKKQQQQQPQNNTITKTTNKQTITIDIHYAYAASFVITFFPIVYINVFYNITRSSDSTDGKT